MSQLMNPQHAALHENGDIHIHDMDFMNMGTLTCCQIDLEKLFTGGFSTGHGHLREPQDITSYALLQQSLFRVTRMTSTADRVFRHLTSILQRV